MLVGELGVLGLLPRVELAKLVTDAQEIRLLPGEQASVGNGVFLVSGGRLHLRPADYWESDALNLAHLGPGEVVGEWSADTPADEIPVAVATEESVLYRISPDRWQSLLAHHPALSREYQLMVMQRLRTVQGSLARYKRYLHVYASQVWPGDEEMLPGEDVAAALVEPIAGAEPDPEQVAMPFWQPLLARWQVLASVLTTVIVVATGVIAWITLGTHPSAVVLVSLILAWTGINWYLNVLPDYAVALTACVVTVAVGISGANETFSGFADSTWFLLLGAFGIGAAIQKSGLLYRVALQLLRKLPPSYFGQSLALALSGTLLTPALPSVQSRVTMAGLLARELSEAMRFSPKSQGSAGLAMSAFLGFGQMRFVFLNGSSYSLLAWGLLPQAARQSSSWSQWFLVAAPLGVLVLAATFWITTAWMFRAREAEISRVMIDRQLSILGPVTGRERLTLWVTTLVLLGFLLQPIHGVDASWIALAGFLALVVAGALEKETITGKIDWQYMLFYGCLAGMVALVNKSELAGVLSSAMVGRLSLLQGSPSLFLLAVSVVTMVLRLFLQPGPAIILIGVTFFPLTESLGYNPLVAAVVVVAASTSWLVPPLLSSYTTLFSASQGRCFDHDQVRPMATVHSLILLLAVVASVPVWHLLGVLVTK